MLAFLAASTASMIAVSCGTPTPATIRVVQIEPGPMPTLIASAPASISACAPSMRGDIAGDDLHGIGQPLDAVDRLPAPARNARARYPPRSNRRRRRSSRIGALKPPSPTVVAAATRSAAILAGEGMGDRLLDVLHGNQSDAAILIVDDKQLLDPMLCSIRLASSWLTPSRTVTRFSCVINSRVFGADRRKRTSRLVRMPTSLPGTPLAAPVTTGMPENRDRSSASSHPTASRRDRWSAD